MGAVTGNHPPPLPITFTPSENTPSKVGGHWSTCGHGVSRSFVACSSSTRFPCCVILTPERQAGGLMTSHQKH